MDSFKPLCFFRCVCTLGTSVNIPALPLVCNVFHCFQVYTCFCCNKNAEQGLVQSARIRRGITSQLMNQLQIGLRAMLNQLRPRRSWWFLSMPKSNIWEISIAKMTQYSDASKGLHKLISVKIHGEREIYKKYLISVNRSINSHNENKYGLLSPPHPKIILAYIQTHIPDK